MPSFSFLQRAIPTVGLALVCLTVVAAAPAAPSAGPTAAKQVALPSFACYEARFSALRSPMLRIADRFSRRTTALTAAVSFCTPARAAGAAAGASVHLACHSLADGSSPSITVQVTSPFGALTATLGGAQTLCTPASVTTGGALAALPTGLDDFACYGVDARTAPARPQLVADRFGKFEDVRGRVVSICAPASVDGSRRHRRSLLVCYELTSEARARPAIVRSRYGLLKASPGLRRRLCVPETGA